jgi:GDP-4-dehydro-6-deoxy-D-mannose reductase
MTPGAAVVLVTGAAGFVGRHLLRQLAEDGHAAVAAWRRPGTDAEARGWSDEAEGPAADWHEIDLMDRAAVAESIAALRPDHVYHLAGAAHVAHSWRDTDTTLAVNVVGTHHLLEALREAGLASRVLIPSSATVYRLSGDPLTEDSPVAPANPYALSKLAQERLGQRAHADSGQQVVVARAFNHIGPGQGTAYFAPSFARQIAAIEAGLAPPVLRVGNLEAKRDLMDVRDTVRAYTALVREGRGGEIYNVCSGQAWTVGQVLEALLAESRVRVEVEQDPALLRPNDTPVVVGSYAKLEAETGWRPRIPLAETLSGILEDARRRVSARSSAP